MSFRTTCLAAFLVVMLIAVQPVWAGCSNASLNGSYGYFHGRPSGVAGQKVVVGQMTADGKGNVTGSWTMSFNGAVVSGSFTGTYTIGKKCTGTLTLSNEDQSPADYAIVLDDSHHGFQMLQTDAGTAQPGFAVAQGKATCGLTGKKQVLALNLLGTAYPNVQIVAIVGPVTLDGKGNISGTETFSVGGAISSSSSTGTYTVNADCTGTVQILPSGGTQLNFSSVVVDGGKQVLLIENDNNTTVSGAMQE